MRGAAIGFAAGAGLLQMQGSLPALPVLIAILVLVVASTLLAGRLIPSSRLRPRLNHTSSWSSFLTVALKLAGGALAGFAWAALFAHHYLSAELPVELEGRDITVVGTVSSLPNRFEQGVRFHFLVEQVIGGAALNDTLLTDAVPGKLALSWYAGQSGRQVGDSLSVKPGQRWQLTVRLKRPHGNANPHGFDYEVWLLEQNIRATGYVRPDAKGAYKNLKLDDFVFGARNLVELGRYRLREKIESALAGKAYAGVITALVIGDQRGIGRPDWDVFTRTGIGHLVSISGLHITMIAGMVAGLVFSLWRRSFFIGAGLPLILPAQKAAALAGALAALIYVALAGFGIPAQRTLYMLWTVALALWFGRLTGVSHVLCLALGAVVLLDPWAVLWPGFWLSFSAVAVILYASTGRASVHSAQASGSKGRLANLRAMLAAATRMQMAITVGLVPLTLLLFAQVSLISPVANALAIPLISYLVTPLALAGSILPVPLSDALLNMAHGLTAWLAGFLVYLSDFRFAVWSVPSPPWWVFLSALAGTAWMLAPRGWPVRWIGLALWAPLLLNTATRPPQGEIWVTAFDVGQGSAVLIETENRRLLYDTGPSYGPDSDGGSRVIVPYLKARGIEYLDMMMVSHKDNDHSGGALSIMNEIRVGTVLSSLNADSQIAQNAIDHRPCQAGQAWRWDEVNFEVLFPGAENYGGDPRKTNAVSCVLKASINGKAVLLPGDIEARQEAQLLSDGSKLSADILLAPHHGSGTSSSAAFLQAVDPEIALFQVGYRNRFRHPKQEVFDRYGEMGIQRFRTDESGAILIKLSSGVQASSFRQEHPRYWHGH